MQRRTTLMRVLGLALLPVVLAWGLSAGAPPRDAADVPQNEAAAIEHLRRIVAAQVELQAAGTIDTNCDEIGEFGYLAELSGRRAIRACLGEQPAAGVHGVDHVFPPLLAPRFGDVTYGSAKASGYRFQMWLPSHSQPPSGDVYGVLEDFDGGKQAAPFPNPSQGASLWCCYAWPQRVGVTGNRAFCVNQEGTVLECSNDGATPYSGVHSTPGFGEAFVNPASMASELRIGGPSGGADGTIWTVVER